jgi:hypothetical protein
MGIIYLVPGSDPGTQNIKDEYITISSTNEQQVTTYSWEKIGSAELNLDNYYTKSETDAAITAALASYMTSSQAQTLIVTSLQTALGSYYNKTEVDALLAPITAKIPTEASSSNQLADKAYVAAQVQEYAGTFRGTFNSVADLEATTGNHHNDYAWVQVTDSDGDNDYDRYKYNGTAWVFEYRLNNTHFTAAQLAAISSGITSEKVGKLDNLPPTASSSISATTGAAAISNTKQFFVGTQGNDGKWTLESLTPTELQKCAYAYLSGATVSANSPSHILCNDANNAPQRITPSDLASVLGVNSIFPNTTVSDLNNFAYTGYGWCPSSTLNRPSEEEGEALVLFNGGRCFQLFITTGGYIFARFGLPARPSWSQWIAAN